MVEALNNTITTFPANLTALKQPLLILENLSTFEYQKLDRHLQAGLPLASQSYVTICLYEIFLPRLLFTSRTLSISDVTHIRGGRLVIL